VEFVLNLKADCGRGYFIVVWHKSCADMQILTPDTIDELRSMLTNLQVGESASFTGEYFKKLTGNDLSDFASEGRFMIGNLSARTDCTVATTNECVIFTKNPYRAIPSHASDAAHRHF
jgi:hypothetical protein